MPIAFSCHSCRRNLRVKEDLAGSEIYCPDCKSILTVPAYSMAPAPAPNADRDDVPMAEAADVQQDNTYSAQADVPPPPPPRPLARDDDDDDDDDGEWDEAPPRRIAPPPTKNSGGGLPAILGGLGMLAGAGICVLIGIATNVWLVKVIIILAIAGVATLFKGLFNSGD